MEEKQDNHKTVFRKKIKEISASKSLSIKKGADWERYEYGVKLGVNDNDDVPQLESMVREHVDGILVSWMKKETTKPSEQMPTYFDIQKISWHDSQGEHGPFQRSIDRDNPEFQKAVIILTKQHKMIWNGWYIWLFKDGKTLGRKPSR